MKIIREDCEIYVPLDNLGPKVGQILQLLDQTFVEVLAYNTHPEGYGRALFLIVEEPRKAEFVLRGEGYPCQLDDVLWVAVTPYQAGVIAATAFRLIGANIGIRRSHIYTLSNGSGCLGTFQTTDNDRAVELLAPERMRVVA